MCFSGGALKAENGLLHNPRVVLSKPHRLQKSNDIQKVIKTGARARTAFLQASCIKTDRPVTRIAFIVPNRVIKKAAHRNKTKRRMREAARHLLPRLRPGFDLAIWGMQPIQEKTLAEIEQEMQQLFIRLNICAHA